MSRKPLQEALTEKTLNIEIFRSPSEGKILHFHWRVVQKQRFAKSVFRYPNGHQKPPKIVTFGMLWAPFGAIWSILAQFWHHLWSKLTSEPVFGRRWASLGVVWWKRDAEKEKSAARAATSGGVGKHTFASKSRCFA